MKNIDLKLLKNSEISLLKNWITIQKKIKKGKDFDFQTEIIEALRNDLYDRFILRGKKDFKELILSIYSKASIFDEFGKKNGWINVMSFSANLKTKKIQLIHVSEKVEFKSYLKLLADCVFEKSPNFKVWKDSELPALDLRYSSDFTSFTDSEKRQLGIYEGIFEQFQNVDLFISDDETGDFQKVDLKSRDLTLESCENRFNILKKMQFCREIIGDCELSIRTHTNPVCDFCGNTNFFDGGDDRKMFKLWGYGGKAVACENCTWGDVKGPYDDDPFYITFDDGDGEIARDARLDRKNFRPKGQGPELIKCFHR